MNKDVTAVVYICWLPFGADCFAAFLDSYKQFPAGAKHDLIIVFKGGNDTIPYLHLLHNHTVTFKQLYYVGSGLDIDTYRWCANQLPHTNFLFLNSRSRFLTDDWLAKFHNAAVQYPQYVLGCTGSWQSYASSVFKNDTFFWEKGKTIHENTSKYKRLLKAATLWWYYFPLFPNPHLRTNAFFINRQLFLLLQVHPTASKMDAYRFESGRNGFSKQLEKRGYKLALLSKNGLVVTSEKWPKSKIFWSAQQEELVIADNQTEVYSCSGESGKKHLQQLAWGRNSLP